MRRLKDCLVCGKKHRNRKFCSHKCEAIIMKKNKTGIFDPVARAHGKRLSHMTNKKNKTGFYDPQVIERRIRNTQITCKKRKVSAFYDPKIREKNRVKGHLTQKKNKTGFFNSKLQSILERKGGKVSCPLSIKKLRKKKDISWNGLNFDSWRELEIAMCIFFQLGIKLKSEKNCHVRIGGREYDFFINGIFLEYHPVLPFYKESEKEYLINRRKNLNQQGYKKNPLLLIR